MSSRQTETLEFVGRIKEMGFRVWLAESGTYGFISDEAGDRVLSFSFSFDSSLSGNYGPPSRESGTGWKLDQSPDFLTTADTVRQALNARPPEFCGKGWKYLTTVAQHLAAYGASSEYREV